MERKWILECKKTKADVHKESQQKTGGMHGEREWGTEKYHCRTKGKGAREHWEAEIRGLILCISLRDRFGKLAVTQELRKAHYLNSNVVFQWFGHFFFFTFHVQMPWNKNKGIHSELGGKKGTPPPHPQRGRRWSGCFSNRWLSHRAGTVATAGTRRKQKMLHSLIYKYPCICRYKISPKSSPTSDPSEGTHSFVCSRESSTPSPTVGHRWAPLTQNPEKDRWTVALAETVNFPAFL